MKKFFMVMLLGFGLVGCSVKNSTPNPVPDPIVDTTEPIVWDWEGGSCPVKFSVQVSDQNDPTLRAEWTEVARTDQVSTEDNPFIVDFPDRPIFVVVRAICTNGSESDPSNVVEVK